MGNKAREQLFLQIPNKIKASPRTPGRDSLNFNNNNPETIALSLFTLALPRRLVPNFNTELWTRLILSRHSNVLNYNEVKAKLQYISIVSNLQDFGVSYFLIHRNLIEMPTNVQSKIEKSISSKQGGKNSSLEKDCKRLPRAYFSKKRENNTDSVYRPSQNHYNEIEILKISSKNLT